MTTVNPAGPRVVKTRLAVAVVTTAIVYLAARLALELRSLATGWRVAAAILPVACAGWIVVELLRGSRRLDELQQRMQLEALSVAYSLVFLLLMLLGLLELAVPLNRDDWSYRHVWAMQGVIYLAGLILAQRRYGVRGK